MLTTKRDAELLTSLIIRELESRFSKTRYEAENQVTRARVYASLMDDPLGLHDSPYKWALSVLTQNNDIEVLERYYATH